MLVEFENRSGEMEQAEMEIDEPCPICCGMLFPVVESKPESGYRCSSCGLVYNPVDKDVVPE
ncbi:MAG: hypothetical protein OXD54_05625 [Candidatus Poribacteria bacterium]|nr:hypothetical protein [Candidatus Poribacteria bacterium]